MFDELSGSDEYEQQWQLELLAWGRLRAQREYQAAYHSRRSRQPRQPSRPRRHRYCTPKAAKERARNRERKAANREHYRELARLHSAAYRARQRAARAPG
jgi:hypothetical protein